MKKVTIFPPTEHENMTGAELLKALKRAGRWSNGQFAHELGMKDLKGQSVKDWLSGRSIPDGYLPGIEEFVRANAESEEIADAWWSALSAAWNRDAYARSQAREAKSNRRSKIDRLVNSLQKKTLVDRKLNRLPPIFETEQALPLLDAYVELRLAQAKSITSTPLLLEQSPTLAERIQRRSEQRFAVRRSPKEALDQPHFKCRLILGPPGSGKSSLMRRLALDIAGGHWKTAAVPLFVEARAYAESRRKTPNLSLVDYACRHFDAQEADIVRELLAGHDIDPSKRAILLVDGLDEIASDSDAVSSVYGELADSSNGVMWIVTARPAGLVRALGENQRYEMVELDASAIDELIKNWCEASSKVGLEIDADALQWELERVPGIRAMSTNPFLLTALCFLKSTAPDERLPNSRVAVYERLIERIAFQAQSRHSDRSILSEKALRDLSDFACFLYESPQGVVQIFRKSHWCEFVDQPGRAVETDFERQILPARLLTVWHESDPQYHFLHLTLQEYLIAQAMIDWPVTTALKYRYFPAWRNVFRFYGALLWQRGRRSAFEELTSALFQKRDINNLQLITLAEIFADAGVRDTTPQLGVDLREELLKVEAAAPDIVSRAFTEALVLLDADWLTERIIKHMHDIPKPYDWLVRCGTRAGKEAIEAAFRVWVFDAASAFGETATPTQLQEVAKAAAKVDFSDSYKWSHFLKFARARPSEEFLPFLERVLDRTAKEPNFSFDAAVYLLVDIGGSKARKIIKKRLFFELERCQDSRRIYLYTFAVADLCGRDAIAIFNEAKKLAPNEDWLRYFRRMSDVVSLDERSDSVGRSAKFQVPDSLLSVVSDAVSSGVPPTEEVIEEITDYATNSSTLGIFERALHKSQLLAAGKRDQWCCLLTEVAFRILSSLKERRQRIGMEREENALWAILVFLQRGCWRPARSLVDAMMDDRSINRQLQFRAIALAGYILKDSNDQDILRRIENILYDGTIYNRDVTLAMGRIKLDRLFFHRGADCAEKALAQIAFERDYLIFEDEWVDRGGKVSRWEKPIRSVLCLVPDHLQTFERIVSHQMSRYGLFLTRDSSPDTCAAALIIEPLDWNGCELFETDVRILKANGKNIYRMPAEADLKTVQLIARTIAASL